MSDTNRAEFEAWWLKDQAESWARCHDGDTNTSPDWGTAFEWYMWRAWQAARAQSERVALSDAADYPMSGEQIIDIAYDYLEHASGGMYQSHERQHFFGEDDAVIAFASAILAAQADTSTQSTDAENVSKTQREINMDELMSQRMILCETCGNKRCPHANDPANYACTGSNEPGQVGSAYPAVLWNLDPHPPSRHCMCEECKPSFETDCLGSAAPTKQPLIAEATRDDVALDSALYDAMADQLNDLYYCTRQWSAWSHRTMSENDFHVASEDDDTVANFVNAARAAIAAVKRDDVAGDAAHHRLLNAATTYANNYLQDERDEPELCIHTGQHAEIVELFAAIATNAKEKT